MTQVSKLDVQVADLRRLHPILEMLGPDVIEYRTVDIREAGEHFQVGQCPSTECLDVVFLGVTKVSSRFPGPPEAMLGVKGDWGPIHSQESGEIHFSLLKGCGIFVKTDYEDLTFVIIDDRAAFIKLAIAVTPGTGTATEYGQFRPLPCK